ncbi:nitrate reductase molybdenum cofactor assembly chaperone [Amycolatopsis nigrescens]|uniref:nitrate reductase molybdenum cofactor assembly chaperone n=1 Tax=Amycolatopsis nigrescens TaxID=381445 RepID=UPI00037E36C8|nr:nitrate reductase molybdenum cofactor assembly chaperone [Amycolatopsis nigrescens]
MTPSLAKAGTDTRTRAVLRQIAGWCLQYPDHSVLAKLGLLQAALHELGPAAPGHAELTRTLRYLRDGEPGPLAERYVEVFDRRPRRTLHLSWFLDGDTRRRGGSLAGLRSFYREHGFAPAENELPDYLPVVLEFAAAAGPAAADAVLVRFQAGLDLLHRNLDGTPYQDAVAAVLATMPPSTPDTERLAAAILGNGPPTELVGLDPFPTGAGGRP